MMFGRPKALYLLLTIVPLLSFFMIWAWRRKQFLVRQFIHARLLSQLNAGVSTKLQKTRLILLVLAVTFLILSIARPQWGFAWEEATQRGRDIVVAIDTSKSMLATDIAPNRLARAKLAALDLLKLARRDRLGLVSFAGTAFLQCPLTLDDEAFRQSVQILEPGIIPQGGTAIGEALDASMGAFKKEEANNHRIIVLITDGEDHEEQDVTSKVNSLAEAGVRIFTIGVGTPNGEVIKIRDERGNSSYLKDDQGNVVKSRLNESLLQDIATKTHAFYLPLRRSDTMETLYQNGLAPLPTSDLNTKLVKRFKDQFYWPLGIAMLLLIAEIFIPEKKRASTGSKPATDRATPAVAAL